jgi:serine/threonine protein kinase
MKYSSNIGKVLDNYRIVECLGEGGMGVVYKAVHTKLDKVVALKMIAPGLAMNSKFIRRFQTEAKALAKLQDPNIVAIHDLRSHENQWFIAMEFVEGIDLYDKVSKEGAFSWQVSIQIIKQILSAIGHAHKAGIIHRDLKPHNIMLTADGKVKITDFGLAKDEANQLHTMTVASGGTLNYMSPEHVKGFSYIEKRSDLYCIGIILYEMVTGEVPFKNLESDFDIRESILRKDFDTPTSINTKVPGTLEAIIMKSIEKHSEDRFQSAEEILEALEDFEKGKKIKYKRKRSRKNSKLKSVKILVPLMFTLLFVFVVSAYLTGFFSHNNKEIVLEQNVTSNISIKTNPEKAIVFLNTDSISLSPLNQYPLQPGVYNLKVFKNSFETIDTSLTIVQGKNLFFSFDLKSILQEDKPVVATKKPLPSNRIKVEFATLLVNSEPSRANVYINKKNKGITPLSLSNLESGKFDLKITKTGYKDYSENFRLDSGERKQLNATLQQYTGNLMINTEPDGVTLSIDGEIVKIKGSSEQIEDIPVGNKKIIISKSGYSDYNEDIVISYGKTTTINATLSQLMGKLIVKTRPWGSIYINNELRKSSTDMKYEVELPVDIYNLKVKHPTLGFWQKDINITNKNITEVLINFNKKIPVTISAFGENGEPFAGKIFIDDKFTGKTTPQEIKVPIGVHKIFVEKQGFVALQGQRELLIGIDYKEPVVFILKEVEKTN